MDGLLMNPGLLALLVACGVALYMFLTLRLIRRNARLLWIPALAVAVCATLLYWTAYGQSGAGNWFSRLALSVVAALDLFLFKAVSTLGGLLDFFYVKDSMPEAQQMASQSHLILLQGLFLCAMWTTSILTVFFFARRLASRLWLFFHRPSQAPVHIFFGDYPQAVSLASDLARKKERRIMFVIFPVEDVLPAKVSVAQMFRGVSTGADRMRKIRDVIPGAVVLSARSPLEQCQGQDLFREMGLSRLASWLDLTSSSLYLLSDDPGANMSALQKLPPCKARIYCRAGREGLSESLELVSDHQVILIDRSFLTVKQMKMDPAFHPVHFVERALDASGEPEGWVKSPFRSMVLGFGETGRGALSFLYEFGSFVGKDRNPVPFHCEIIDRNAGSLAGTFRMEHPGIPDGRIGFTTMEIGSEAFWNHFVEDLPKLNYIALSLGDDQANVRVALDMISQICREGSGKPALVIKLEDPARYSKVIDFYARSLGVGGILILGGLKTWTEETIIDEAYGQYAKAFYEAYCRAADGGASWERRADSIMNSDASPLWKKLEYRRKTGQDYSDYLHRLEKAELCPRSFIEDSGAADSIPSTFEGSHCDNARYASVLEYLAIGEHLRWMASHEMEGYRYAPSKREDLKIHPAMLEYGRLSDSTRHFDWIVVKTTLQLLHGERRKAKTGS